MLRQSVFGRVAGYEDVNDAERLGRDPTMRWVVGGRAATKQAASSSQIGRFETDWLANDANLVALADLGGRWIDRVHGCRPLNGIVLDMDSSVSETYGDQEGTAYNGHFACTRYHPLFVFNQFGDLERCALRSGNVHSAHGWKDVLEPVVARYRGQFKRRYFRADAAFTNPEGGRRHDIPPITRLHLWIGRLGNEMRPLHHSAAKNSITDIPRAHTIWLAFGPHRRLRIPG